ncbi:MAG TPA: MFS transporter [Burkholderiales bacterium]|nr:MFS transporter [Burkholderiales bacterium]
MDRTDKARASALAIYIGVVQFFFAVTWTVYVVYLPQLVEQAGIARSWVPWILIADQLVFAVVDVATGFWVDRVRHSMARLGPWILAVSVLSGLAFIALPFMRASPALLLGAIFLWAVTSSALRSPPWALLSRHAATPRLPWVSTLTLTGTALAAAASPYLGMALRGVDPRVPFLVSTLTLLAAVGGLVIAERRFVPGSTPSESLEKEAPQRVLLFYVALLVMALGFQVHFSLNSAPQYLRFAAPGELPWLLPVFWIGFNLAMFPASRAVGRLGAVPLMAVAAACGALASLACGFASTRTLLLCAQFVAGAFWGAASVAAYTAAMRFGRTGREGRFLGTLFAVLAVATLARIATNATGLAAVPDFKSLLPWLPAAAWLGAGVLLVTALLRSPKRL